MRRLTVLAFAALLGGCVSAEDEARQRAEAAEKRQAAYHQKCIDYGFTPGTEAYGNCRQNFDALEAQRRTRMQGVLLQHMLAR